MQLKSYRVSLFGLIEQHKDGEWYSKEEIDKLFVILDKENNAANNLSDQIIKMYKDKLFGSHVVCVGLVMMFLISLFFHLS